MSLSTHPWRVDGDWRPAGDPVHDPHVGTDFEATEEENHVGSIAVIVFSLGSLAVVAVYNLFGVWWPGLAFAALVGLTVLLFTAWAARTRHQSLRSTLAQVGTNPRRT